MTADKSYPPPYPHDPIQEIADDVFMVRGSIQMNALMRISRNMGVIRHDGSLMLINPIRLDATGEEALAALGDVKWMLRLGAFHGQDDCYYKDRFGVEFWCQPGGKTYPEPAIDVPLDSECRLPFPDATLIPFARTRHPESVLLLSRGNGLLFSCDSIQHYGDYRHNNWIARMMMPFIGFPKTTIIGPFWLKFMTPEGQSLRDEFEALMDYEFDSLLSAHGSFLASGAKVNLRKAIDRAFPK